MHSAAMDWRDKVFLITIGIAAPVIVSDHLKALTSRKKSMRERLGSLLWVLWAALVIGLVLRIALKTSGMQI
jgi:hypothetical protein